MGFCYVRCEKVKTLNGLRQRYAHNYRDVFVPNADSSLRDRNEELVPVPGGDYCSAFREKIKSLPYYKTHSVRKDAVRGVEVIMTFSREALPNIDIEAWKKANIDWLRRIFNSDPEKYGDNIAGAIFHGDEAGNVHIHAMVIPIDGNGHLNSTNYIGGPAMLSKLQDSYAGAMEPFGLSRGIKGHASEHESIRAFYRALNDTICAALPEPLAGEDVREYYGRANEIYRRAALKSFSQEKQISQLEHALSARTLEEDGLFAKAKSDFEKEKTQYVKKKASLEKSEEILKEKGGEDVLARAGHFDDMVQAFETHPDQNYVGHVKKQFKKLMQEYYARQDGEIDAKDIT